MKRILFILFLLVGTFSVQAQSINWMSLEDALAKQKKAPKPIFLDVYTDWCSPCKMMDNNTYKDVDVVEFITKNYYPVKFNAEGNTSVTFMGDSYANPSFDPNRKGRNSAHQLTKFLKVPGYPAVYILDKKGNPGDPIAVGFVTPEQLMKLLR